MCKNCKREYNKARYVAKKRSEASTPTTSFSGMSTPLDMSDNHDVNDTLQQAVHAITHSSNIHASLEDRKEHSDAIASLGVRTEALELVVDNVSKRVNTHSSDIHASAYNRKEHGDAIASLGVRTETLELRTKEILDNLAERVNALKLTTDTIRLALDDIDTRVAAIEDSRSWRLFPVLLAFSTIMALCMRRHI